KAGMFPLHIWLPRSHPVAPSPASALLSGILTKVGIFGILMTAVPGFFGNGTFAILILIAGTITMALGAVLALFSVNLKRSLACSSMSQIGFILVGIGTVVLLSTLEGAPGETGILAEESMEMARNGLVLHMVNHSMIKLTLFMAAGVFVMRLHMLTLDDIRGYGRKKPLLMIPFLFGALGISGVPLFNGYISKTLLHEGLVTAYKAMGQASSFASVLPADPASLATGLHVLEWIFLISGGLTFAYMLKLFICIFVEKHPEKQKEYDAARPCMSKLTSAVLFISSLMMPLLGVPVICEILAAVMTGEPMDLHVFSPESLSGAAISLGIGALIYILIVRGLLMKPLKKAAASNTAPASASIFSANRSYVNRWPQRLDLEELLYRPLLLRILPAIGGAVARFLAVSLDGIFILLRRTILRERTRETQTIRFKPLKRFALIGKKVMAPIIVNFSFSLMLACLGILVVLGVIMIKYLF
ncbi:MAG: sodium:proton antiporter, partial [Eubacterium sp.]|nr:sodium:proton antiporter [Eubacterium sp.]